MENLDKRSRKDAQGCCSGVDVPNANTVSTSVGDLTTTPMPLRSRHTWNDARVEWKAGEFYRDLLPEAMSEFESLAVPFSCEGATVVFTVEQEPCSVLFLLQGRVKLTMNSSKGKRITLGIAGPGETLGLAAVITGSPYESTAVAEFPCRITALPRQIFLDFLLRHPVACQNSARLLCVEYQRSCEQLRILALPSPHL